MTDKKKLPTMQIDFVDFFNRGAAAQKAVDEILASYNGNLEVRMRHLVTELIYHGRFFSPARDKIVVEKSLVYILAEFKKWKEQK